MKTPFRIIKIDDKQSVMVQGYACTGDYSVTVTKKIKKFNPDENVLWEHGCPKIVASVNPIDDNIPLIREEQLRESTVEEIVDEICRDTIFKIHPVSDEVWEVMKQKDNVAISIECTVAAYRSATSGKFDFNDLISFVKFIQERGLNANSMETVKEFMKFRNENMERFVEVESVVKGDEATLIITDGYVNILNVIKSPKVV
jgi:hypothetical protein